MARINIEEKLFLDHRFQQLQIKLGSSDLALGTFCRAVMLAQKYWAKNAGLIPMDDWQKQGFPDAFIETKVATLENGCVKVMGIEEQFAWLTQRIEAGRAGGKNAAKKRSQKQTGERPAAAKQNQASFFLPPSPSSVSGSSVSFAQSGLSELQEGILKVYEKYPRKKGKIAGIKRLLKQIKTPKHLEALNLALDNFLQIQAADKVKLEYYPYFSTWTSTWVEFIRPDQNLELKSSGLDFGGLNA